MAKRKMRLKRSKLGTVLSALLLLVCIGIPLAVVGYQARQTGMTWAQVFQRMLPHGTHQSEKANHPPIPRGAKIDFLVPQPIGLPFTSPPRIANVQTVDLDQDGLLDILVCDCVANFVSWIRQHPQGTFTEQVLADGLIAPAHVQADDFDRDGDLDLLVAVLGMLFPNNDRIGSVVILENDGENSFSKRLVIGGIARVSDARAGDLDGDGDKDLAVTQFGYDDGETRWIENLGNWQFRSHMLQTRSGGIHCEIADLDGDSRLDLALLISQEWEECYVFAGDGKGQFRPRLVFAANDPDYGSSGMWLSDLDRDGDQDIVVTNGDAFDYLPPHPWPWHSVQWLENQGEFRFQHHHIASLGGAVGALPLDVDHDGDSDLVAISAWNQWDTPDAQSLIWLENDGRMQFVWHDITNTPTHLQTIAAGDFDNDGQIDLVTGGMHVSEPYDRVERIVLWWNRWPEVASTTGD